MAFIPNTQPNAAAPYAAAAAKGAVGNKFANLKKKKKFTKRKRAARLLRRKKKFPAKAAQPTNNVTPGAGAPQAGAPMPAGYGYGV
jgi:hypothetical protein